MRPYTPPSGLDVQLAQIRAELNHAEQENVLAPLVAADLGNARPVLRTRSQQDTDRPALHSRVAAPTPVPPGHSPSLLALHGD